MKRIIFTLVIAFINVTNANCQDNKKMLGYFLDIQTENIIVRSSQLWNDIDFKNEMDTVLALKYFFDNDAEKMHDIFEGYNADENTYTYTPYTKKVCPLYKVKMKNIYLLYYCIDSYIYISFYNNDTDKVENTLTIANFSNEGGVFTRSIIFPNNYILTVKVEDKAYYILSKIDYKSRKFIELKRIETNENQSDEDIWDNAFDELGISETGELLEENQ